MSELVLIKCGHSSPTVPDYHEWITLGQRIKADSRGRLNPHMYSARWTKWICNNYDCPAWALVSDQMIQDRLEAAES